MKFNEDVVPSNLNEAVSLIRGSLSSLDVVDMQKENFNPTQLHDTFGRYLRNSWSLWEDNTPIKNWFMSEYGISHADDISSIILDCLWRDIKGEPRQDKEMGENFKKYWKKMEESNDTITFKISPDGNFIFDDGETI